MTITPITWVDDTVVLIDQRVLPHREEYRTCRTYQDVIAAIRTMAIRGAPAIGIAAAMAIALGVTSLGDHEDIGDHFDRICHEVGQTRPTAVNLFWAINRMKQCFERSRTGGRTYLKQALIDEAVSICRNDIEANRRMGQWGKDVIHDGASILTHCNAGALATGGYGTALGVIRAAHDEGKKIHVFADETRPVLQGARLTVWEMQKEHIPVTLIVDSAAGSLMRQKKIDLVLVGADRIAANGDTANKIGTYSLAILAAEHGIPLYVAAPTTTIDRHIICGNDIPIEERGSEEVLSLQGVHVAPNDVAVLNPAFDVTPARYITAIITESGVIKPPFEDGIDTLFRQ